MKDAEELAKWHYLKALFEGSEPGRAEHLGDIKAAIEFALTGKVGSCAPLLDFAEAGEELLRGNRAFQTARSGLAVLDLRDQPWEPLWIRQTFLRALVRAGERAERGIVIVLGLKEMARAGSRRATTRARNRFRSAREYLDKLAAATPMKARRLTLLYL